MPSQTVWLELISWTKTLHDGTKSGIDLVSTFNRYRNDPETIREASEAARFSTFSDYELESIQERIENCKKLFIQEGVGEGRVRCLCSILNQAREANGGELPDISDWLQTDKQLKCLGRSASLKSRAATS